MEQLLVSTQSFQESYQIQVVARGEVEGWVSHSVTGGGWKEYRIGLQIDIFGNLLGLGLGLITDQKKKGLPSPRAEAGQGNI